MAAFLYIAAKPFTMLGGRRTYRLPAMNKGSSK
jgi:hypothetical protein